MPGSERVGYVRMNELIKKHPLYNQLAQYDSDIQTLGLRFADPGAPRDASDIAREEQDLKRQLNDAADKTQKYLKDKQVEYASKERAAIGAALAGGRPGGGAGGAGIAAGVNSTYREQAQGVVQQADKNYQTFSKTVIAQDEAATRAVTRNLGARAERSYRAKADELQQKEGDFSLKLAGEDAGARLELRTKLSNLALDDAAREETKAKLAALDRKEADALAAVRNRDGATLETYQQQLRAQTQRAIRAETDKIHAQTAAKLRSRQGAARAEVSAKIAAMQPGLTQTVSAGGTGQFPPDVQKRLQAIHQQYNDQFHHDADQALAQYNRTRDELSRRFSALHSADGGAQAGARSHIDQLQKQRGALYDQMIAQIKREIKTVALAHGISVVLTDIVAPAGGVDLTVDAEKDIESLHE